MRAIFYTILFLFTSALQLQAQNIFDSAACSGANNLHGYNAEKILNKSREWVKGNITILQYNESDGDSAIIIRGVQDYNAGKSDKLPKHYSGKFEYTLTITAHDGYYSYNFVNVRYIPGKKLKKANGVDQSGNFQLHIKKSIWEKISSSAFKQLQETGKKYDKFMQAC